MKFIYPVDATPFNQDDLQYLIPKHIITQNQLNEWEHGNIQQAELWLFSRKRKNLLSLNFMKSVHKKMFERTWLWAGSFRTIVLNIGVPPQQINFEVITLLDDIRFQLDHQTYAPREVAARFHHRLVKIHPFVNGNGRHARLMADGLLYNLGLPRFDWGSTELTQQTEIRKYYIQALQAADNHDYSLLLQFLK